MTIKKINFSRKVVKILDTLLDEPHFFGECYYRNKVFVISVRKKVESAGIY
jgi:hypothetical protein